MLPPGFTIQPVQSPEDLADIIALFREYAATLDEVDLAYQNFEEELATLPGKYAPPAGVLLLARDVEGVPLGCVGLRPLLPEGCCEMKRLYVSPAGRGKGLGRALVLALLQETEQRGYREIRLDTLPTMGTAIALYQDLGFQWIPPYFESPVPGNLFMAKQLA